MVAIASNKAFHMLERIANGVGKVTERFSINQYFQRVLYSETQSVKVG